MSPFKLRLNKGNSRRIEGVLSWNFTSETLELILKDLKIKDIPGDPEKHADSFLISGNPDANQSHSVNSVVVPKGEPDPVGASTFVIAVILIYGLSIIFLIASHMFMKKRPYYKDSEKRINAYLEQAPQLRDQSKRESFKKLKRSLLPIIARSPSGRTMIAKRIKYTPYLIQHVTSTGPSAGSRQSSRRPCVLRPYTDKSRQLHTGSSKRYKQDINPNRPFIVPELQANTTTQEPTIQKTPRKTDVIIHVHSASDDESDWDITSSDNMEPTLGPFLYGGRSHEDVVDGESEHDSLKMVVGASREIRRV